MALPRRADNTGSYGGRAFFVPVLWIVALVGVYCILADWQAVPAFIAGTVAAIH